MLPIRVAEFCHHINQGYGFSFDPTLPVIAPLSIAQGTLFLNPGFIRVTAGNGGATVGPGFTADGITTNGSFSGALHGRLGLSGPAPLDDANEQIAFN